MSKGTIAALVLLGFLVMVGGFEEHHDRPEG